MFKPKIEKLCLHLEGKKSLCDALEYQLLIVYSNAHFS